MTDGLPDEKRFEASNRRYLVLASVGAFFVVALSLMRGRDATMSDETNVWLTVLFAIMTLIGAAAALLKRSWLKLDREGFESSELRSLGKLAWRDVSDFRLHAQRTRGMPSAHQVAFDLNQEAHRSLGRVSGILYKDGVRLTENYRIRGRELVALMNAFRARALAEGEGVPLPPAS